jgi:exodeoxyribonuclease-3
MKIASWNVNSLKVRLPQVLEWIGRHRPDVLCLQETKSEDANFPLSSIRTAGYEAVFSGQKTYNGVAILSRIPPADAAAGMPGFEDAQKRVIAATFGSRRVVCVYVPNGEAVGSEKFQYKLAWLEALHTWLKEELARHPELAILGDFNIAPEPRDVHDPALWEGKVLFSDPERAALDRILALGFKDAFRLFEQPENSYTWWDYRMNAFRRKMGLRIDHILLSATLAKTCTACTIDLDPRRAERPSDHAPIVAELSVNGES